MKTLNSHLHKTRKKAENFKYRQVIKQNLLLFCTLITITVSNVMR